MVKKSKADSFVEKHESTINFVIAGLLVIAMVLAFFTVQTYFGQDKGEVVASVNYKPIYQSELDAQYENLPITMRQSYTRELLLEEMIQEELLEQRADELRIRITGEDIDQAIDEILEQNDLNMSQFEEVVKIQGMTMSQFEKSLKGPLRLKKLLDREAFQDINITRDAAFIYYEENPEEFTIPETIEIRHFLLEENVEDAEEKARELSDRTSSYNELCSIVDRNYQELSEFCGTFNITRMTGVPDEFIETVFNMRDGRTEVVETVMGHHVIQRVDSYPPKVQSFRDIQDRIEEGLIQAKKQEQYRIYLAQLREDAVIKNYLLDRFVNETFPQKNKLTEEELSSCVADAAVLYGARWDAQTKEQITLLGDAMDKIEYVDCAVSDSVDEQSQVCDQNDIEAYPTWIINGRKVLGKQSLQELADIAGC